MVTRLAAGDLRPSEMVRQDSSGLGPAGMSRTSSAELVLGLRQKPAATSSASATVQSLRTRKRTSPARTVCSSALLTSATADAPATTQSNKPINFFPSPFQPTLPGTGRSVITVESSDAFWDHIDANPDRLVVLMSKSYGCRPCKAFNKKYERVAGQNQDAVFLEIFGDENDDTREMMVDMCVKVTPTFHMFKGGRLCHMHTGINEDNLRNAVASHQPHYDPAQP